MTLIRRSSPLGELLSLREATRLLSGNTRVGTGAVTSDKNRLSRRRVEPTEHDGRTPAAASEHES